jgi:peptidoglycan-associated lipoprotein
MFPSDPEKRTGQIMKKVLDPKNWVFLTILLLVLAGMGCAKKDQVPPGPDEVEVVEEEDIYGERDASLTGMDGEGVDEQGLGADAASLKLQDIPFEFDRYNLSPDARMILKQDYAELRRLSDPEILVEGHCDNRGTVEYNLALGQRRADAVKGYLISLGMPASRIGTISYGEEMPLDPRNNEEAWALNRRAHILILTK